MAAKVKISVPPVGVKLLKGDAGKFPNVQEYQGKSYCYAIHKATYSAPQLLRKKSLTVCQWAPPILGFKRAENYFEARLSPHLPRGIKGIYLARLEDFPPSEQPDVVILRTTRENYEKFIGILGPEHFVGKHSKIDKSAWTTFSSKANPVGKAAVKVFNPLLMGLNRFSLWRKFTELIFKSTTATAIFNLLLDLVVANMSMCRNSTVIPYLEKKANISYFCAGGIAWGENDSAHLTAGFPWGLYQVLMPRIEVGAGLPKNERDQGGGACQSSCQPSA